jgi:hypothetical protein
MEFLGDPVALQGRVGVLLNPDLLRKEGKLKDIISGHWTMEIFIFLSTFYQIKKNYLAIFILFFTIRKKS